MSAATTTPKGELTRSAIVEVAHELFITHGYHGTSMRQIAKDAGIALGGIYNHFDSKEDVFRTVFLENHPYLEMLPAIESAQGDTIEELVRDAANQMLTAINRKPHFLNLMFIEIVEFKSAHTHELFKTTFPRGMQIVQRIAEAEGSLRTIPPPMLIRAFVGLFFSYHLAEIIIGEAAPPEFRDNAIDYYVDILLHGILEAGGE
ncbi:MAG: TetR/AcrR family transcriptional regulator [Chloroflexi bacterium]|nr:TetR/AcrR family transcriptional regulator [Chloroflexota bacterium]